MHTPTHPIRPCDAPPAQRRADRVCRPRISHLASHNVLPIAPHSRRSHIPHPTSPIRLSPAFSLVEITIVVIIIAILSSIAVPRFGTSLARYRADHAASRLRADLSLARDTAIHQSRPITVTFVTGAPASYTIVGLRDSDRASVANSLVNLSKEPYFATFNAVTVGGDSAIIFDGFGVPDSAGQIDLSVGLLTRAVLINSSTGEVTITSP